MVVSAFFNKGREQWPTFKVEAKNRAHHKSQLQKALLWLKRILLDPPDWFVQWGMLKSLNFS